MVNETKNKKLANALKENLKKRKDFQKKEKEKNERTVRSVD